ncbi:hypothetical protein HUG17_4459 [Dermatophagoides farinae]|uniref:Protein Lines C-terminal domain-containing protein n=1 Tax=Dermatophagoides farinae TaxID=6954 RepID=A0A9D4NYA0_DERFA|nr:hypothetical protein HUG17_4459 [Dermatophagoides farinae]
MSLVQQIEQHHHHYDCSNSIDELLSVFNQVNTSESIIFLQHWNTEILKEKLLLIKSLKEFEQIWIELLSATHITSIDDDDDDQFDRHAIILKILIPKLNNYPQSSLWKSFHYSNISAVDENQCLCNSLKCLKEIIFIIHQHDDGQISEFFDQQLESILESYHQHNVDRRCFAYELLKFSSFIVTINNIRIPCVINKLKNWIQSDFLLKNYLRFFSHARDFAGNILTGHQRSLPSDPEFNYDCPLIRCYILFIPTMKDSYRFLSHHLNQLKSRIENCDNNSKQNEKFPIKWLIEIFITEDSELFEMFHQILLLYSTTKNPTIVDDNENMLCTDQETASIVLRFLIAYLRILPYHCKNNSQPWFAPIVRFFHELGQRIQKLDEKNLFPYSPKPLLRLMNNI